MPIKILNTAIERILNKEMAELGITYTQATVIGFLNRNKDVEICQRNIEENLGLTHPTVSSILARLEEKKIIPLVQSGWVSSWYAMRYQVLFPLL